MKECVHGFKKPMIGKMPLFYQEVFTAWAEFVVNVNYEWKT